MKILFVTSGTVKSNFTYRIVQLARSMKKLGHDVAIVAPIADKYNDFKPEKITEIYGVRVIQPFQFKTKRLEINLLPYMFHALYLVIKNRSDLVYIYKPTPISIVGVFAKYFYKSKVVLDMDDIGSEVMKIEKHPFYRVKLVEWCERLAAYSADFIVTASNFLNSRYKNIYPNKPILTISNGVDNSWFKPLINSDALNRVVFMGAMNRLNIVEPLIDVLPNIVKKVPDIKVLIIGDGKFLPYFKQKVSDLGLNQYVSFTGWLKVEEAEKLLLAGDVGYCYMPNELTTKSASNMKVMQYMARGVVPLVSDIGDLPLYVDNGRAGYIAKADDNAGLESTMLKALNDKERNVKSKLAQEFSVNNFDWDKLAEKFDKLFDLEQKNNNRIYFLTSTLPGNVGGAQIRDYNLLKNISLNKKYEVSLFCIGHIDEDNKKIIEKELGLIVFVKNKLKKSYSLFLKSILIDRVPPYMNEFKDNSITDSFIKSCLDNKPKLIHLSQLNSYYMIKKYIPLLKKNNIKVVLDCHNIEHKLFGESLNIFPLTKRIIGKYLVKNMEKLEIEAVKNADIVLACSDNDKKYFKKYNNNTFLVPNGVDVDLYNSISPSDANSIIFMGGVDYPPNADAVIFYFNSIHKTVKNQIPDLKVYLVGTSKEWFGKRFSNDDSVFPLGFVPDVSEYLKKSAVGISPLRYGSGTRLKILTYMAAGLPVVSTFKGAEGVNYQNETDLFMEDDPEKFAKIVVKLLSLRSEIERVGENGRKFVKNNFAWKEIGRILNDIYENI